jgi:Cellulase (glycosyl hydrolase family 5)
MLALGLIVGLLAAAWRPGAAAAQSPIGAHSMLQLNDPPAFMRAMFAEAAAMDASAIRLDVAPALVFGDPSGMPDFSGLDQVVALAAQYHLRVVADLVTIPWWLADCDGPTDLSSMDRCGTDRLSEYESLISQIVTRAEPVIRDWEIWNEPDTSASFSGTPAQYALMLRAAYDAIKAVDPQDNVLLGGISDPAGQSWLGQVFATPGADAAQAFDIATIHERGDLDALAVDVGGWKQYLSSAGFTGPLWVTEHGYPSDPAYQYDPSYAGGPASQAAFLAASIPTLIDAGAAEVLVTERDNLGGEFASEGVLGGDVADPGVADPQVLEKPAFAVVQAIAGCYIALGRDCAGPPPIAAPAAVTLPPVRLGSAATGTVNVEDPGPAPLRLGTAVIGGTPAGSAAITLAHDTCSGQLLEPNETCALSVRFAPITGGPAAAVLELASDSGSVNVPVSAVAPSVSSLTSPQLPSAAFVPTQGADGVGYSQRLRLSLSNSLSAAVGVTRARVSGTDSRRFEIQSDTCVHRVLAAGTGCRLSVLFTPVRAGTALGVLTLDGAGTPLVVGLRASAFPVARVTRLSAVGAGRRRAWTSRAQILIATDEAATVRWSLARGPRRLAGGRATTSGRPVGPAGYAARLSLRLPGRGGSPAPGAYIVTVTAVNRHGAGPPRSITLTVPPRPDG